MSPGVMTVEHKQAIEALKALQSGEPVAWLSIDCIGERFLCFTKPNDSDPCYPLYTTPQPVADVNQQLVEALKDMLSGWRYIREVHGDLYGVGWDRAQQAAEKALLSAGKETV
jgi:hypothetical protein